MQIAVLGATSQIAKDWILSSAASDSHALTLYARQPHAVERWLDSQALSGRYAVRDYAHFGNQGFDAILNFVGVGDPARAVQMGASIFEVTARYDQLALDYLQAHPQCRYIFLSSGAAYGSGFAQPADASTQAQIPLNDLQPQHWYGVAKLHAECRHRALPQLPIVDLRIFNYFSHTQDMAARFFITDILRAIKQETVLQTSGDYMVRDYLHPADFYQLVHCVLAASAQNVVQNLALDCYSQAPVDKTALLARMQEAFGLRYEVSAASAVVNSTGSKPHYYSTNRRLADLGYQPRFSSLDGLLHEFRKLLT